MKANLSRPIADPPVQRRSVLLGQGQVILDAYVNEQAEITARRIERGTADALGSVAVPLEGGGFRIAPTAGPDMPNPPALVAGVGDLFVSPGRLYLGGWLLENPATTTYARINGITAGPAPTDGTKLAYLEAWLAQRTDLDEPALRDPAIDPADVPGRVEIRWRLGLLDVPDGSTCGQPLAAWDGLVAAPQARLAARLDPGGPADEHCDPVENGGYRGVENSLYRVEVMEAGTVGSGAGPSITWARDNAAIAVAWRESDAARKRIRVDAVERGGALLFHPGDTIELVDGAQEAAGVRGRLVQVAEVEETWLVLDAATPAAAFLDPATLQRARVRLWAGPAIRVGNGGWVALEDGIQIRLRPNVSYASGQYWLVPARVRPWGTSGIALDWPTEPDPANPAQTQPAFLPPAGPERRFARLALLRRQGGVWTGAVDCRPLFPAATALLSLVAHGGDGQTALPGGTLPAPLRARLTRGTAPVAQARIRFRVTAGGGTLLREGAGGVPVATLVVVTAADGATPGVLWTLAGGDGPLAGPLPAQEVIAELLPPAPAGTPPDDPGGTAVPGQAVRFAATPARADQVAYTPVEGKGLAQPGESWITVQEAINRLAARETTGGDCMTVGEGGRFPDLDTALQALAALLEKWDVKKDAAEFCFCLLPGRHAITKPIEIVSPNDAWDRDGGIAVSIRGCTEAILVQRAPVAFRRLRWLLLEQLAVMAVDEKGAWPDNDKDWDRFPGLLTVDTTRRVRLRDLRYENQGLDHPAVALFKIIEDAVVADCRISRLISAVPQSGLDFLTAVQGRLQAGTDADRRLAGLFAKTLDAARQLVEAGPTRGETLMRTQVQEAMRSAVRAAGQGLAPRYAEAVQEERKRAETERRLAGRPLAAAAALAEGAGTGATALDKAADAAARATVDLVALRAAGGETSLLLVPDGADCTMCNLVTDGLVALYGPAAEPGAVEDLANRLPNGWTPLRDRVDLTAAQGRLSIDNSRLGGLAVPEKWIGDLMTALATQKPIRLDEHFASITLGAVILDGVNNAVIGNTLHLTGIEVFNRRLGEAPPPLVLAGIIQQGSAVGCRGVQAPKAGPTQMAFGTQQGFIGADPKIPMNHAIQFQIL